MTTQSLRDKVTSVYKESFMKPEIFHGNYVEISGDNGSIFLPLEHLSLSLETGINYDFADLPEEDMEEVAKAYQNHIEGNAEINFVSVNTGYVYRLSASGYMDCTDFSVAESEEEALKNLLDMAN